MVALACLLTASGLIPKAQEELKPEEVPLAVVLLGTHLKLPDSVVVLWQQAAATATSKSDLRGALDSILGDTPI